MNELYKQDFECGCTILLGILVEEDFDLVERTEEEKRTRAGSSGDCRKSKIWEPKDGIGRR